MRIENELPGIKRNILLRDYTTFKIGGPARYFFIAKTKENLIKAIRAAEKYRLPFFILGKGSNLLVSDKGYNGLVINFQFSIFNFQKNKIIASAGTKLGELVNASIKRGLTGLEWAVGIPGTVGGAIYGNAGAFGKSMKDITKTVTVLEIKNQKPEHKTKSFVLGRAHKYGLWSKIKNLRNKECKFNYRESIFKKNKKLIILSSVSKLKKGRRKEIQQKVKEYLNYRKNNQPLNFPSAGSVFKNPADFSAGRPKGRASPSAGELIEKAGLKGKKIGSAQISDKHANFILNLGKAKAKDVKKLINLTKKRVKSKFGINLEEEIQYLGF